MKMLIIIIYLLFFIESLILQTFPHFKNSWEINPYCLHGIDILFNIFSMIYAP